jgi:ubiquinone/menaquinone biosynthesis C-methylase UbiE
MTNNVNPAEVFGNDPQNYDNVRIGYDTQFVGQILQDALASSNGAKRRSSLVVADVGAGTGQLGEEFLKLGYKVIFVEPNVNSVAYLRKKHEFNPNVTIINSKAENIEIAESSADIIVMGDAAHWIDEKSITELRRILNPEGQIISFSRFFSQESPITHKLHDLLLEHCEEYPESTNQLVRNFGNMRRRIGRHLISEEENAWRGFVTTKPYTQDELVDFLKSLSFSANALEKDEVAFRRDIINPLWDFAREQGLLSKEDKLTIPYEISALYGIPRTRFLENTRTSPIQTQRV